MTYRIAILSICLLSLCFTSVGQDLEFSHDNGYHGSNFTLQISCKECDQIKYSVDGTEPSVKFTDNLEISSSLVAKNRIAHKPTNCNPNISDGKEWHTWMEPGDYEKAVSLKAIGYKSGKKITKYFYRTFFFHEDWDDFPTFSLNVVPSDFYNDSTGISVPGIHVDPQRSIWTGNYHQKGKKWERPIHMSFFDDGITKQDLDLGVRIHGLKAGSAPQKSLRLYARSKYGSKAIEYDFDNGKSINHKRILLRTPFSCHASKMISDVICQELARPLNVEIMDYGFARTFLNGEYWGLHLVRERVDEKYLVEHFGGIEDSIQIPGNYDQPEFQAMFDLIEELDMSKKASVTEFGEFLDLENFTDYVILETHFRNTDWLEQNNNVTFWKERNKGKWRLILIDLDAAFQKPDQSMIAFMDTHSSSMISKIFQSLMLNPEYRQGFIDRYAKLLQSHLSPKRCFEVVDSLASIIEPEMAAHVERWGHPTSVFAWKKELDDIRYFFNKRVEVVSAEWSKAYEVDITELEKVQPVFYISQDEKLIGSILIALIFIITILLVVRKRRKTKKAHK